MTKLKVIFLLILFLHSSHFLFSQRADSKLISIQEMFDLAEANSRSIRTYDLTEKEAEQAVQIAKNALLPSVDVSLSASYLGDGWIADRDFSNGANAPMPHFGNNFAIEASQVIYAGGAISNSIAVAKLRKQLARLDKVRNREDIRFLLVGNYLELFKLQNQAAVYRKNIEQTVHLLADVKARQKEGLALKNDITRHELQLKTLEQALLQINNGITIANNELVTVLGMPLETSIRVDTCLLNSLPVISNEVDWQVTALESSPLLQQAKLGIEESRHNEKIVNAERLPSVALIAGDHLDGPITNEVPPINKNFNYWYVGIGIKYNLASLYKTGSKSRLARYSHQKAVENELLLRDNIQTQVKASHVRFAEAFAMYDTQKKSLELAEQNYDVINNRYLNDLALITDMLDAGNSKLSAELQVVNARINILFNYYKLKKATGTL
ncbi:MAG: TolC family protein [Macellibacteroides fermentans]|uniref:TolC family protein n=1 Tax=Macellibacteroides fermentans TaxID=879969 RepID=UPI003ACDEC7F